MREKVTQDSRKSEAEVWDDIDTIHCAIHCAIPILQEEPVGSQESNFNAEEDRHAHRGQ